MNLEPYVMAPSFNINKAYLDITRKIVQINNNNDIVFGFKYRISLKNKEIK